MDRFSKKILEELAQMQQHSGRILRSMSLSRMMQFEVGGWQPAVDIYESAECVYVYADLAGVAADSLRVSLAAQRLEISGQRALPTHPSIACVHQLEIELGRFQRSLPLPAGIDAERVHSTYTNGVLMVTLPKTSKTAKRTISIQSGEKE